MSYFFLGKELLFRRQIFDDIYVEAVFHDKPALPWGFSVFSVFTHRIQYR